MNWWIFYFTIPIKFFVNLIWIFLFLIETETFELKTKIRLLSLLLKLNIKFIFIICIFLPLFFVRKRGYCLIIYLIVSSHIKSLFVIAFTQRILFNQFICAFLNYKNQKKRDNQQQNYNNVNKNTFEMPIHRSKMSILPNNICWLICLNKLNFLA